MAFFVVGALRVSWARLSLLASCAFVICGHASSAQLKAEPCVYG